MTVRADFARKAVAWSLLAAAVVVALAGWQAWEHANDVAEYGSAVNAAASAFGAVGYGSVSPDHSDAIIRFIVAAGCALVGLLLLRRPTPAQR
jgi:uncharacterized membrane protein YebE (DUF533 family)